jgi:CBS-domain-containing membrane protein
MKIRDLMCSCVQTCRAQDSLAKAAELMWDFDCGAVPVVDDQGALVGMITDRDIAMAAYLQGKLLSEARVFTVMARDVETIGPEDSPVMAEFAMQRRQVRRLPVVDEHGRLLGIVSLGDMAHFMAAEQSFGSDGMTWSAVAHTLAAVSTPRSVRPPPNAEADAAE